MDVDLEQIKAAALREARRLDTLAVFIAVAVAVLLTLVLDMSWAVAILIAIGVYVGVHLLRPQVNESAIEQNIDTSGQDAIAEGRSVADGIRASIDGLPKETTRALVSEIAAEIDVMFDAIDEDSRRNPSKLAAAPLYYTRLVRPFGDYLSETNRLMKRRVKLAEGHMERLDSELAPQYLKAAQEFYQEYHNQDVLDLAALEEILRYNLDSLEDDDLDVEQIAGLTTTSSQPMSTIKQPKGDER